MTVPLAYDVSRRLLLPFTFAAVAACTLGSAWAEGETWPVRTVRMITLAAAGAGTDAVARTLADAMALRWRPPVIVDNRPGGDGIVSIETFFAARDSHTLLFDPTSVWTALHLMHERLSFGARRDLVPLAPVVQDFIALGASPKLSITTLGRWSTRRGRSRARSPGLARPACRTLLSLHSSRGRGSS